MVDKMMIIISGFCERNRGGRQGERRRGKGDEILSHCTARSLSKTGNDPSSPVNKSYRKWKPSFASARPTARYASPLLCVLH